MEDIRVHAQDALDIARVTGPERFLVERAMQHAVVRCFTVIGEAANRVSDATRRALPAIPWTETIALRNVVVHEYRRIDYARIWTIVEADLPPLLRAIEAWIVASGPR
jgi:uncharacterized protein with HEPN domain